VTPKPAIGMIGVGLMGHGIAWNIARAGYRLTVLDHPGNQPLDDLREMQVRAVPRIADVAGAADVIVLCVTGTPQVEAILTGPDSVLARMRPGTVVVDCSTALPASTERMAAAIAAAGGRMLDAAMTRTPKEARAGTLNLLIGGDAELLARVRPLLETFAENITHIGPNGAGHRMKLLHNYVSLGFMTLLAEAAAHAGIAGLDPAILIDVLAKGGGGGTALQRMEPFLRTGDASNVSFFIANAAKDLDYYRQMARDAGAWRAVADAVGTTLEAAVADGHGLEFVPKMADLLRSQRMPEPGQTAMAGPPMATSSKSPS
jgi:3-hydroxyisobutyrate dehydrogenase-like beta-hydroxyacid dehydrogenase